MANDVKDATLLGLRISAPVNSVRYFFFWFAYFLGAVAVVGGVSAYGFAFPLMILGYWFQPLWRFGGKSFCLGVEALLKMQPWLNADAKIQLPAPDKGAFVTVSNHRSHLDMFFLLSKIANIRVVAKETLFYVPFLGLAMRVMKNISITKGSVSSYLKAMEKCREAVLAGDPVHVFPEMTRCNPGFKGVQEFHLAPFRLFHEMDLLVVPIVFKNTDRAWPKGKMALSFREKVEVFSLPPLRSRDYAGAEELRQAISQKIVQALLEKP